MKRRKARGFIICSESHYGPAVLRSRNDRLVDDITLGYVGEESGKPHLDGELFVEWIDMSGSKPKIYPRLHSFFDNLQKPEMRALVPEVLALLAPLGDEFTPMEAKAALLAAGWKDLTRRTDERK